jgi:hypothetical protein
MILNGLFAVIILATVALLFKQGLWSNTLCLFNAITAGLIATNFFEPVSRFLSDLVSYMDYNWDVIVLGALFGATYMVLKLAMSRVSRVQVRFHPLVDQIGGGIVALWLGWVGVCFVCFALHTSPLAKHFLSDNFQPEDSMFFGLAPDRLWLGFVHKVSNGGGWGRNDADEQGNIRSAFDPTGEFMLKYGSRRRYLEKHQSPFAGIANEAPQ